MKIAIIGGGASGVVCAIYAKRTSPKSEVTIFERSDRILKKILVTGNGRCNLSNINISAENYHSDSLDKVKDVLTAFSIDEERQFLESIGLMLCEENGRIYPYSKRANDVSDALRLEIESLGIEVITNAFIKEIRPKNGGYTINGKFFDRVIICAGGSAAPKFGTDGNSFRLIESIGHSVVKPACALVPLMVEEHTAQLKGIRAFCSVNLFENGKVIKTQKGEVQFTDYGLSGIVIMNLSHFSKKGSKIEVDLFPEIDEDVLFSSLLNRTKLFKNRSAEKLFVGTVHKAIILYILSSLGISHHMSAKELNEGDLKKISHLLKHLPFTVKKTLGWDSAQVTRGGASLLELSSGLESLKYKGIYIAGEALDCVGECGGYNLFWAFATGAIAGKNSVGE